MAKVTKIVPDPIPVKYKVELTGSEFKYIAHLLGNGCGAKAAPYGLDPAETQALYDTFADEAFG